jgi:dihydrofolate reductase
MEGQVVARGRSWRGKVFIGTSVDGYIARRDDDIAWLVTRGELAGDYGYDDFIAGIDHFLIGRGTYDLTSTFPEWPYGTSPVLVLSRTLVSDDPRITVVRSLEEANRYLEGRATGVYIDGGQTIQESLRARLVDDLIVSRVPVLIGDGKPLFGSLPADIDLELVNNRDFPGGMTQTRYRILHQPEVSD